MNENLANEIRKTIESIKDMKAQVGGLNEYLSILEGMIRSDYQKKVDEAYQRGYDKGYADKTNNDKVCKDLAKDIYQRGLNDAWEAARKIVINENAGGLGWHNLLEIFECETISYLFRKYSASEAIDKLKAYEEKQKDDDKIKVMDEVVWTLDANTAIVVTSVYTVDDVEWCDGICKDGKVYSILTKNARKTGRRFDIDKFLEEIRNEQ